MTPLGHTLIIYTAIMLLIYYYKPKLFFDKNELKQFGIGENKTILPLHLFSILFAILLYSLFCSCNKVDNKNNNVEKEEIINKRVIREPEYTYRLVRTTPNGTLV